MRNEANFLGWAAVPIPKACGLEAATRDGQCVKRSQFHDPDGVDGALRPTETPCGVTTNRASVPNEPNFGPGKLDDKCCGNKQLQRMGCATGIGKTKPNGGSW